MGCHFLYICILCFKTFLMITWGNWHVPDCALWTHAGKALPSLEGRPGQSTDGCIIAENENQEVMTLGPTFLPRKGSLKLISYASQTPSGHVFFCSVLLLFLTFWWPQAYLVMHPLGANIQQQITSFVITEFIYFSQSLQSFVSRDLILKVKLTPVTRQSAVSIRWSPTICRWAVSKAGVGAVVLDVVVSSLLSYPTLLWPSGPIMQPSM